MNDRLRRLPPLLLAIFFLVRMLRRWLATVNGTKDSSSLNCSRLLRHAGRETEAADGWRHGDLPPRRRRSRLRADSQVRARRFRQARRYEAESPEAGPKSYEKFRTARTGRGGAFSGSVRLLPS